MANRSVALLLLPSAIAHLAGVVAVRLQIFTEADVLLLDGVLVDLRQPEDQKGADEGEGTGQVKGVLPRLDHVFSTGIHEVREHVVADETTDLARSRSDGIVLTAEPGGRRLGSDETNVVTWTDLTQRKEDSVDDDELSKELVLLNK